MLRIRKRPLVIETEQHEAAITRARRELRARRNGAMSQCAETNVAPIADQPQPEQQLPAPPPTDR